MNEHEHADDTPDAHTPDSGASDLSTGDPQVDAAVARLDKLDDDPGHEVEVYEDIHQRLRAVLDDGGPESR